MADRATKSEPAPAAPPHKPYVGDQEDIPEFTWQAVVAGSLLGIVFGASSLYLVLKVGLTVSASIPVAVLSITLFRVLSKVFGIRRATILENNIVQTAGSAGESIAFGVGVTMPALMLLGFEMDIGRVMVISLLGGVLGILMMIPLRRVFIVKQHGTLVYPEGTACADVLIVGEQGGTNAKTVFVGFGIAFLYQFLWQGMKLWKEVVARPLHWFKGAVPAMEVSPTLIGVGYIIGTKISCIMVAGGVLSSFLLIPAIRLFGDPLTEPLYPATDLISKMKAADIQKVYVMYIGAGAVAAGGIISLFQALPLILRSIVAGLAEIRTGRGASGKIARTDRDLPPWIVIVGSLVLVVAIWATSDLHKIVSWVPDLNMNWLGATLIVVFGFLFVTVSSRLTGEIGSSSNPISGMTVATLLLTCLIFLAKGWVGPEFRLTALSVAAIVCIAASNGGTTSQDLKTGYLVGATPKRQQLAIVVGAVSSALVIGVILIVLNEASTIYSSTKLPTPQKPIDLTKLTATERAPHDDHDYHVWHAVEGADPNVPQGKYLVDDQGTIRYLVDPGINGRLTRRDDGTEVQKYDAPKARLMALITDGILNQKLPWTLVLLGVAIAVVLELCQVPSLPFAVGVYLPLSASTPIFIGGLIRGVIDRFFTPKTQEGEGHAYDADMSPGVLLSTGYIAGGAIAGVVIAFLSFSETIPAAMGQWEHRQIVTTKEIDLALESRRLAGEELHLPADAEWNDIAKTQTATQAEWQSVAEEIEGMNAELPIRYAKVRPGMELKTPDDKTVTVKSDEQYLYQVAASALGDERKAAMLYNVNEKALGPARLVPSGVALKLPQQNLPALLSFFGLAAILVATAIVGRNAEPSPEVKPAAKRATK
jgi:putative OPT family oligopeptide transporter